MRGNDVHRDDMFDEDPMIAAFARDLQDAAATTPAPVVGASLAAVLEGRAPATAYPDAVETPRARVVRRPARLRWAVAAAAAIFGAGSLGVAGALPGPVQRQVSRMADVIGVDVPDGEDDTEPTTTTTPPTTTTTSTTIATTTSTAPPVGTTVLTEEQDAGEDPGKPAPERDDEGGRGRGRGGVDGEPDDREDDARNGASSQPEPDQADVEVEREGQGNSPDPEAEEQGRSARNGARPEDVDLGRSQEQA